MKLGIVNTDSKDGSHGGISPIMRNMHDRLSDRFDLTYFYLPDSWKRFPLPNRLKSIVHLFLKRKELKKCDFILSHISEGSYVVSFMSVPYAHVFHGNHNPMVTSKYWYGKYFKWVFEHFAKRIHKTAAIKYTVGPVFGDAKKLINPIKHNVSIKSAEQKSGFIFAGRLETGKRIDRIIEIYSQLPSEVTDDNKLYIAGYGSLESYLKKEVSDKSLEDKVIFLGNLPNPELIETDSTKKILLMASTFEGFPTAMAEALSVAMPVVSTICGDIPNFIEDGYNGRLLPQDFGNQDYINAVIDILDNYDSFSKNALESAKVFDSDTITQTVIDDICKVISQRKS